MTLGDGGALAAIGTFVGGGFITGRRFVVRRWRRQKIEQLLIDAKRSKPGDSFGARRYVGQIANELRLTPDEVYDAARLSRKLEFGSDTADVVRRWLTAKDSCL